MDCIAAFDCAELLERLPIRVKKGRDVYKFGLYKTEDGYRAQFSFQDEDCYTWSLTDDERGYELCVADTPAEALGKLYLWCLENGYVKNGE